MLTFNLYAEEYLKETFEGTGGPLRIIDNYNIVGLNEKDQDRLLRLLEATGASEVIIIAKKEAIYNQGWLASFKRYSISNGLLKDDKKDFIDSFIKYKPSELNSGKALVEIDKTIMQLNNLFDLMNNGKGISIVYYFYNIGKKSINTHGRYWLRDCLPSEQNEFTGLKGLMVDGSMNRINKNLTIAQELSPDNCTIINDIFGKDEFGDGDIYPRTRYEKITKEDIEKFIYALRKWKI